MNNKTEKNYGPVATGKCVHLMSGGPRMTVCDRANETDWNCTWIDSTGNQRHGTFPAAGLVTCKPWSPDEERYR